MSERPEVQRPGVSSRELSVRWVAGPLDDTPHVYADELYRNIVDWYRVAETKAQIVLTLDGVFATVVAGALLVRGEDLRSVVSLFGAETWALLAVFAVALSCSIGFALWCLVTRVMPASEIRERYGDLRRATWAPDRHVRADVLWFFQTVAQLPKDRFHMTAAAVSAEQVRVARQEQNHLLAAKVVRKHILVNWAFGSTAVALLALIGLSASYLVRAA